MIYSLTGEEHSIDVSTILRSFNMVCKDSILEFSEAIFKGKSLSYVRLKTDNSECLRILKMLLNSLTPEGIGVKEISCSNPFDLLTS